MKKGVLYVVVARNTTVKRIKGILPEHDEQSRKHAIEKLYPDAVVVLGDTEDYSKPIRDISPDLILMGYDQKLPPGLRQKDLSCPVERLEAFMPYKYKSSLLRKSQGTPSGPNE